MHRKYFTLISKWYTSRMKEKKVAKKGKEPEEVVVDYVLFDTGSGFFWKRDGVKSPMFNTEAEARASAELKS